METKIHWTYTLNVTKEEFLLVSKALRSNLKSEDGLAALALQEKMMMQKHSILEQALEESAKVIVNIEKGKIP